MKVVLRTAFVLVVLSLALGSSGSLSGRNVSAQAGTAERPCGQPVGVSIPVDLASSTPSTEPRLVFHGNHDVGPLSIEWAWGDWDDLNQTVFKVPLTVPLSGAVLIGDGIGSTVKAVQGNLVLMACGGPGLIDTKPEDGETIAMAEGESRTISPDELVMIFLEETPDTSYWIFGAGTAPGAPEAIAGIEVFAENGAAQVCGYDVCWDAPTLPARPDLDDCDHVTCAIVQPGGCGGVRCWSP